MKPNFALNLSHDGITLLHRASAGWHVMGEVALDAPDMSDALAQLRERATSVSTAGLATKLVIPNSQILYRSLPDPGPAGRDAAIRSDLEGATPYTLDELIWDSSSDGATLQVAVIARETLEEAESFATEHRFNPVSLVALPEAGSFTGEPFFGRAKAADRLIGAGTKIDPDTEALQILPQRPLPPEPVAAEPPASPEPVPVPDTMETAAGSQPETLAPAVEESLDAETAKAPSPEILADQPAPTKTKAKSPAETAETAAEVAEEITEKVSEETGETASETPAEPEMEAEDPATAQASGFSSRRAVATRSDTDTDTDTDTETPSESRLKDRPSRVLLSNASAAEAAQAPQAEDQAEDRAETPIQTGADQKTTSDAVEHPHAAVTAGDVPLLPETEEAPKPKAPRLRADPLPEPPPMPTAPVAAKRVAQQEASKLGTSKPGKGSRALGALKSLSARSGSKRDKPAPETAAEAAAPATAKPETAKAEIAKPATAKRARLPRLTAPQMPPEAGPASAKATSDPVDLASAALPTAGEEIQPLSDRAAGLDRVENTRDEAEALTIFGARRRARGGTGKPRYLGLVLTGGLILVLLLAGLLLGRSPETAPETSSGAAPESAQRVTDATAASSAPSTEIATEIAEAEAPTEVSTAEEAADDLAEADLAAEEDMVQAQETGLEPEAEPTPELVAQTAVPAPPGNLNDQPEIDREALEATYAATGIWPLAPENGTGESVEDDLNALYSASIDPVIASQDAGALPDPARHLGDSTPRAALPPAPPGTRYDYDEDGFVRATPEGTLTPDGTVVYAGRPSVTPAARPGSSVNAAVEAALAPAAVDENDPTRLALAGFRPNLRPDGLIESNEKANLGGMTRAELAAFRPLPRPASAQELAEEEARYAGENEAARTAPVVMVSLRPTPRPANIEKLAAAARAAEAAAAAAADAGTTRTSAATQVTARVPETALPRNAPANVAQAATSQNVINLRRLNLMGVYGSNSDRRALVRLPSGRFAKVKVGDQLDGGRVQSIGSDTLTYLKRGRAITLEIEG
ncbi:hypothetical protein [Celeribacter neptunius]|uniref:Type IV pilus biogenesis protein PilP n=1 Tax=Celeribacter neptunius TaxID=588602 RepID=A0A1I3PG71_9RHOB|nr:hypothetical protein [Celeribacter neptunius]SFJ20555.1 type IV pilus biogenesis protein PilP [Celeribacter neptunius]